jgi:sialidase-1
MRIPGITVTSAGDIIIYNEARRSGSDWAHMDIVARISRDGGATFSPSFCLAHGTEGHPTVNNPVMAEDARGALHFLYCEDYGIGGGRILHRESRDGGESWSEPVDISRATLPCYRNVFALGPGHGICTSRGVLAFPFWLVPKRFEKPEKAHVPSEVGVLYSKDNGKTWQATALLPAREDIVSPNETVAAETANGDIYLAIRQNAPARACALLSGDLSAFEAYSPVHGVADPICFGSVASVHGSLAFVNCDHAEKRINVTLKVSRDGGATWENALAIDKERGGYADIAHDPVRSKIYILYENEYGKELYLAALDEDEVL